MPFLELKFLIVEKFQRDSPGPRICQSSAGTAVGLDHWRIAQGRELQDLADEAYSARLARKLTDASRPK